MGVKCKQADEVDLSIITAALVTLLGMAVNVKEVFGEMQMEE